MIILGSIVAVTTSDKNLSSRMNRFLGICIRREREGLNHRFTLRNVVDGLGSSSEIDLKGLGHEQKLSPKIPKTWNVVENEE